MFTSEEAKTKQKYSKIPRTIEEVASHNTEEDCWIIIENSVYDVSKFMNEEKFHPGGHAIFANPGKDATDVFKAYHPNYVYQKKLVKYKCGEIKNPIKDEDMIVEFRELIKGYEEKGYYEVNMVFLVIKLIIPFALLLSGSYIIMNNNNNNIYLTLLAAVCLGLGVHQGKRKI
jgi:cytochrome b involved in lipid metabolism